MENRQPTYPGRVILTPVPGQENTYDMVRADNPTVEGTPLNKETLLQDATCEILNIPSTSVPNDAFIKLALGVGNYGYSIHINLPDGNPVVGAEISGGLSPSGTTAVTDENGNAVIVSTSQNITVSVESPYIDAEAETGVLIESTGYLTEYTITLPFISAPKKISTSGSFLLSPSISTYDLCCVGGGGGGGGPYEDSGGYYAGYASSGGGGGNVTNELGITPTATRKISTVIGAGGSGGKIGSPTSTADLGGTGGTTTVTDDSGAVLCTASGGGGGISCRGTSSGVEETVPGGSGNGNGGSVEVTYPNLNMTFTGQDGGAGTVYLFGQESLGIPGGGGGGGGGCQRSSPTVYGQGGAPYGGVGSQANDNLPATTPGNGSGPGGGGGGASQYAGWGGVNGGNGAAGAVFFRPHYVNE